MSYVIFEKRENIAYITLNRPERMNALGAEVREGLTEAILEFRHDSDLRVAIITGVGDRAFCAGADRFAAKIPMRCRTSNCTHWTSTSLTKSFQ